MPCEIKCYYFKDTIKKKKEKKWHLVNKTAKRK